MFEASKHVWLPAKPTNDSMILSFPWVVKACLEHWMQVSIVALTGHRERLWLAEPPKGRKKPKKPLASKFCPVSECWTHESFPGADPENVCSCFSFEILGRNKTCYHELHVWDPSVLCSQAFFFFFWRDLFTVQLAFFGCFTLSRPGQDTSKHLHMWSVNIHPCIPERGQFLVPGMFT